jgi:homoserine O-acetyltransferase
VSGPTLARHKVGPFELESGQTLASVEQAYTLSGRLNDARTNLVVVFHSLTGDPWPTRWWSGVVGPGRAVDTNRYAVLAPNLLGSCYGTTRVPSGVAVTPRDMARLVHRLVCGHLQVETVALATGGSLGGMVTLEWAALYPALTRAAVVFAAPADHPAQAVGFGHLQREALRVAGAPGLALARMIAMMSYRTAAEFADRFGRERRPDGRFQVQSYLDHHGRKLVERFDPRSYTTLLDAMDAHDVARGRAGVGRALAAFEGSLFGVGIPGDLLYGSDDVRRWTRAADAAYREIRSARGHDAFLLEAAQVGRILTEALATAEMGVAPGHTPSPTAERG